MIKYIILTIIGFYLLVKGSDLFIDGIVETSNNLKIPKLIISLTIVAFGTSAPELFIAFKSINSMNYDIAIADVVSSTIINTLLIIGLSSLIKPIKLKSETIKKQLPINFLIVTFFSVLFLDKNFTGTINTISKSDAIILLIVFLYFISYIYKFAKNQNKDLIKDEPKWNLSKSIIISIFSLILIWIGSNLTVDNCVNIASKIHISQKIITMLILVIGTSLPELIMAISSAKKGEFDIIVGNIIGSNIYNLGFVITIPVIILGSISTSSFNFFDMFIMFIASFALYLFAKDDRKIDKTEGLIMIFIFILYYAYIILI